MDASHAIRKSFNAKVADFRQVQDGINAYPPYESGSRRHFQHQYFYGINSDIRDYRLLLLELLTGCPPFDETTKQRLDKWAKDELQKIGNIAKLNDKKFRGSYYREIEELLMKVVFRCFDQRDYRPRMDRVLNTMENIAIFCNVQTL
ncbi:protein STRUBBELIG-RECEPTOR FAMILY 6-like [Magnolia sinica]|uniref:protein STRUBBELIG-RECEPTOR FAMILY 6-like n=1 Tax=Magnolia sinica TaxID=86752 RepID=UPI00265849BF|nr:protein STRUBBELIG-RECEPTOR FAMILY 6-like [Magnolia sinica]